MAVLRSPLIVWSVKFCLTEDDSVASKLQLFHDTVPMPYGYMTAPTLLLWSKGERAYPGTMKAVTEGKTRQM